MNSQLPALCPLCHSSRMTLVYRDLKRKCEVFRCRNCGLVFSSRLGTIECQKSTASHYEPHNRAQEETDALTGARTKDIREAIAALFPRGRVLDIGCGLGAFLSCFAPDRCERCGVEPDPYAAESASARLKVPIRRSLYQRTLFEAMSFDVIIATQVLEHVPSPQECLAAALCHLRPGGLLVIDVPSYNNPKVLAYRCSGIRRCVQTEFIPSHLFYFTRRTLSRLAQEAGFEVCRIVCGRYVAKVGPAGLLARAALGLADCVADRLGVGGMVMYAVRPNGHAQALEKKHV